MLARARAAWCARAAAFEPLSRGALDFQRSGSASVALHRPGARPLPPRAPRVLSCLCSSSSVCWRGGGAPERAPRVGLGRPPGALARPFAAQAGAGVPVAAVRRTFVDRLRVTARAGDGGAGCVSFVRTKAKGYKGPPDGGRGGKGGDVVLQACAARTDLAGVRQALTADRGGAGGGQRLAGAGGRPAVARVPRGTLVYDWDAARGTIAGVLADLSREGDRLVVARGGAGGRGNPSFFTHQQRSPTDAEPGEAGEVAELLLELKTVADIGLVGLPNAGKSSLLRALTAGAATPDAEPYAFTTIWPSLGTVRFDDGSEISVADIPGLVEGAAEGRGLGHAFLRHVERAPMLVYVVDMGDDGDGKEAQGLESEVLVKNEGAEAEELALGAAEGQTAAAEQSQELLFDCSDGDSGQEQDESDDDDDAIDWDAVPTLHLEGEDELLGSEDGEGVEDILRGPLFRPVGTPLAPWRAVELLDVELERYKPGLAGAAAAVVANKMDRPGAVERLKELRARLPRGVPVFPLSATEGWGAAELIEGLATLQQRRQQK